MIRERQRASDRVTDDRCVGVGHFAEDQRGVRHRQRGRNAHCRSASARRATETFTPRHCRLRLGVDFQTGQGYDEAAGRVRFDNRCRRIQDVRHIGIGNDV